MPTSCAASASHARAARACALQGDTVKARPAKTEYAKLHRLSPARLGMKTGKHFVNNCRTIQVYQQVDRDRPRIVKYLKTDAGFREVDLCTAVGEYLQAFISRKDGLLFASRNGTPYLHNNLEQRWLTPRLQAIGIDEKGMGFHAFRRFRKTWLIGKRVQEDINNFWMGHAPETMSETYSRLDLELALRVAEAESMGVGFTVPIAPSCSKISEESGVELVLQL